MLYRSFIGVFLTAFIFVLLPQQMFAAEWETGKKLFMGNACNSCHSADMLKDATGPALGGVTERWAPYPGEIYNWIRNSTATVEAGQERAVKIFAEWNQSQMNLYPDLTNEDIDNILAYIECKAAKECDQPVEEVAAAGGGTAAASGPNYMLWSLLIILGFAVMMLARYINNLNRLAQQKQDGIMEAEKSIFELILNPSVVKVLIFLGIILGGYTTVDNAIGLGRQQGYAPEQPIKFSHALHAGEHKIDCQYCHDGARRSKHSVIPGMNTCMNCHTNIQKGPEHGYGEILKIYASTGFNPTTGEYFAGDSVNVESRLATYRQWLKSNILNDNDLLADYKSNKSSVDDKIEMQLAAARPLVGKTVEWIRIHNLPDHVYFNHSQHVTVGEVECQTCHGEVENMEVVKQYSPLSMGWCINCHRQTEVQFASNKYYEDNHYEQYHQELKDKAREGVTVEEIGGLECQKCHY